MQIYVNKFYHPFHDLCSQFESDEDYLKHGWGVVTLDHGEVIARVSSYTYYNDGIEIEICIQVEILIIKYH